MPFPLCSALLLVLVHSSSLLPKSNLVSVPLSQDGGRELL